MTQDTKAAWHKQLARVQYAAWIDDGAECAICHIPYKSVYDFIIRHPRIGKGFGKVWSDSFVDEKCFPEYKRRQNNGA